LIHRSLATNLKRFLDQGGHKTGQWVRQNQPLEVLFEDNALQFFNINSLDELRQFQQQYKD
jgi:molybdopterin-guanine dinucleotide biosynthesis protein A